MDSCSERMVGSRPALVLKYSVIFSKKRPKKGFQLLAKQDCVSVRKFSLSMVVSEKKFVLSVGVDFFCVLC